MLLPLLETQKAEILKRADMILEDRVMLFGMLESRLDLAPQPPLADWTDYELRRAGQAIPDIKFPWECARFCWAVELAQASWITGSQKYQDAFWRLLDEFLDHNPPYKGPNWVSAQESAIRIITVAFALHVFQAQTGRGADWEKAVRFLAWNARRIPPTLPYARAQNNNHLLLEGVGLYTAGILLQGHSQCANWAAQGWGIIHQALASQIDPDGEYCQHSLNYHRLMLQASLWAFSLAKCTGDVFPAESLAALRRATEWYLGMIDPTSGKAPNFGSNDGAWLLPFGSPDFTDQRPTAQAASCVFLGQPFLPEGGYDALSLFFGTEPSVSSHPQPAFRVGQGFQCLGENEDRVFIRAGRIHNRPFQADALHVDLWHAGRNILLDPGTYSYNAPPPWDNALATTAAHNAVTVDSKDQMTRAGRFLWLDWVRVGVGVRDGNSCEVFLKDYAQMGIRHSRQMNRVEQGYWEFRDTLSEEKSSGEHEIALQWLLPDGVFDFDGRKLCINLDPIRIRLVSTALDQPGERIGNIQLIRAGELAAGTGPFPEVLGWYSPTYGVKIPALSYRVMFRTRLPFSIQTRVWIEPPFPRNRSGSRCISS